MFMYMYVNIYIHICVCVCVCLCVHAGMCKYMCVSMCKCVCVRVHVHACVCACVWACVYMWYLFRLPQSVFIAVLCLVDGLGTTIRLYIQRHSRTHHEHTHTHMHTHTHAHAQSDLRARFLSHMHTLISQFYFRQRISTFLSGATFAPHPPEPRDTRLAQT